MKALALVCGLCLVLRSVATHADMFTDAQRALSMAVPRVDSTGVSMRGGTNLSTGQATSSTTLLRAHATTGGGCGTFDFRGSMQQAFEELPELFESLLQSVIAQMPMLALCYISPTLCDLGKHFQSLLNLAIQHKYAQCQAIQHATMYGGRWLRGGEEGRCLEEQAASGAPIATALQRCSSTMTSLRSPLGAPAGQVNLVAEALEAAGASQTTRTLARDLLGEVTLQANGSLLTQSDRPSHAAMLARYETHKGQARAALQAAAQEWRTTGTISPATLRAASGPAQATPQVAVEALAAFEQDPVRGPVFLDRLSTAQAIERLTWECHEVHSQLEAATEDNQHLSDAEREVLRKRYLAIPRELLHLTQKEEVYQKHLGPAFDALMHEYTAVQAMATRAGIQAPMVRTPPMPFGTQQPAGYSR